MQSKPRENNERDRISLPRITMTGLLWNEYGSTRTAIQILLDIPMAAHSEELVSEIKLACNNVRNSIETKSGQSFYYGVQQKDDIWHGHPGLTVYIDFANNDDLPIEAVHGREHRALPQFINAIEEVLADFRKQA